MEPLRQHVPCRRQLVNICLAVACALVAARPASARQQFTVRQISPGVFMGSAPNEPADFAQLRSLGVRTLLDVRQYLAGKMEREAAMARQYCLCYIHSPMAFRTPKTHDAEPAFRIMNDPSVQPIFVHCNLGKDRSALLVGLYRVRVQGWSPSAAYAEMKRHHFSSWLIPLRRYFWDHARG